MSRLLVGRNPFVFSVPETPEQCSLCLYQCVCLIGRDGPVPQTAAGQVLHGLHADVHEWAQVEEHVIEGVDRQPSGFISVLESNDGRVQGVGKVTEARTAGLNDLLGAL